MLHVLSSSFLEVWRRCFPLLVRSCNRLLERRTKRWFVPHGGAWQFQKILFCGGVSVSFGLGDASTFDSTKVEFVSTRAIVHHGTSVVSFLTLSLQHCHIMLSSLRHVSRSNLCKTGLTTFQGSGAVDSRTESCCMYPPSYGHILVGAEPWVFSSSYTLMDE